MPGSRVLIVWLLISAGSHAALAKEPRPDTPVSANQVLEEVEVKGSRLSELRDAVIKTEDRFISRYNDLNKDDDLDIECLRITKIGTRISYRYCRTKLQKRAQQDDSWKWISSALSMQLDPGMGAQQPSPLFETATRLQERFDDYKKNLAAMLQDDPGLRELAREHGDARRRYEAALPKFRAKPKK